MKVKFDTELLKVMSTFDKITRVAVKDCFSDDVQGRLVFIVPQGKLWAALGSKGANIARLEKALNRKVKIVEFNPDKVEFVKNMAFPCSLKDAREEDGVITLVADDSRTRGVLIGRNASNLRNLEKNVRRFFDVKEIKVA